MDFKQGVFTLQVEEGVTLTPGQIRKAVRARFKIPRIELSNVPGRVSEMDGKLLFTPKRQEVSYTLAAAKGNVIFKSIQVGPIRLTGESQELSPQKAKSQKPMLKLLVEKVHKVEKAAS